METKVIQILTRAKQLVTFDIPEDADLLVIDLSGEIPVISYRIVHDGRPIDIENPLFKIKLK